MTILTLFSVFRPVFLCSVCAGGGVLLCACRIPQAESVPGGAAGLSSVQAPVSAGKAAGERDSVVLGDARRAEQEARLKAVLKSLPPYALHEGSVEEFVRDVDAGVVRFRGDGSPWLDWLCDGARPDFRAVLEDGGKRLRITFFYRGLESVFGTSEEVYELNGGGWKLVSDKNMTFTLPEGQSSGDASEWMQGRLVVEVPFRCVLKSEEGDRSLSWNSLPPEMLRKMLKAGDGYAPAWVHVRVKPSGVQGSKEWEVEKVYGLSTEKDRPRWFR